MGYARRANYSPVSLGLPVFSPLALRHLSGPLRQWRCTVVLRLSGHADEPALLLSSSGSAETLVLKKIRSIQDAGCYRDGP